MSIAYGLDIDALTEDGGDEPTKATQYAVQRPDRATPDVQSDQQWVKDGRALRNTGCPCSHDHDYPPPGSTIVERDITITYGPWRPVGTRGESSPTPEVGQVWETLSRKYPNARRVRIEAIGDGDLAYVTTVANRSPFHDIGSTESMRITRLQAQWRLIPGETR